MTRRKLLLRLAPMVATSLVRSGQAIVLPELIAFFGLTISQGGLLVTSTEVGSFLSMLTLGFVMDRVGPRKVLLVGLPTVAAALLLATGAGSFPFLLGALVLMGVGMSLTAGAVNTLMAETGPRRAVYLGAMHSTVSIVAVAAPLIAGAVVARSSWHVFYRGTALVAVLVATILLVMDRGSKTKFKPRQKTGPSKTPPGESLSPASSGLRSALSQSGESFLQIWPVCLGVFAMAGIQGVLISWSYLYATETHGVGHSLATAAPSLVWAGVLVGRITAMGLSAKRSPRTLLIASGGLAGVSLIGAAASPSYWLTAVLLVLTGIGVSGAFQLGTAWAAERIPDRVGAASAFVMSSATLGIAFWPWLAGVLVDYTSFAAIPFVGAAGMAVALAAFGGAREPTEPAHTGTAVRS